MSRFIPENDERAEELKNQRSNKTKIVTRTGKFIQKQNHIDPNKKLYVPVIMVKLLKKADINFKKPLQSKKNK